MMGRIVNQIFCGSSATPGESPGGSYSVFDGLRGFGLEPRDFTSHFHQPLANVPDFPQQTVFVILFHSSIPPRFCRGAAAIVFLNPTMNRTDHTSLRSTVSPLSIMIHGNGL
jgi:hypothetical protein